MKEIQLTQGQVALVDDDDFERVNQYKWYARKNANNKFYAVRHVSKNKKEWMHRFINKTLNNLFCDHANGNTLDNRKSNLRNCTKSENNTNRKARKDNKSGVKGVIIRYLAKIYKDGKVVYNKNFPSLEEARKAYETASITYGIENRKNKKTNKRNRLGFTGISVSYAVRVFKNKKLMFSKNFSTLQEAKKAYEEESKKHHGEFANTGE